jgi:hypothetical protein
MSAAGAAPTSLPDNADAAWLIVGAEACGTDNAPTKLALPKPAVTAPLPKSAALSIPAPEAAPAPRADPNGVAAPASAGGAAAFASMPAANATLAAGGIKPSPAPIAAVSGTPSTVCSTDDASDSWLRIPESPEVDDDVDAAGDASPCSAVGTAEVSWDSVVCAVPAEVPVVWVTAAVWPSSPLGLVVGAGGVNGVIVVAAAEAPA